MGFNYFLHCIGMCFQLLFAWFDDGFKTQQFSFGVTSRMVFTYWKLSNRESEEIESRFFIPLLF